MCVAARFGHARAVQQAAQSGRFEARYSGACDDAAEYGHLDVLLAARGAGFPWTYHTFGRAAFGGKLDIMRRLLAEGCPVDNQATGRTCSSLTGFSLINYFHTEATAGGHLECLRFAVSCGCGFATRVTYDLAARTGGSDPAAAAAAREALEWALDAGAPSTFACMGAAEGGNADTLRWLRARGCRFDSFDTVSLGWDEEAKLRASGADDELIDWANRDLALCRFD